MRVYDYDRGEWVDAPDAEDWTQHPAIGVILLAIVIGLAYVLSGSPAIIITGVLP